MQLFSYQIEGAWHLATHPRALLADEPGLGKTAQAITAAELVHAQRILVICPAIARPAWVAMWRVFGSVEILLRRVRIVSYEAAVRQREALLAWSPDCVIADEAHYLKSLNPAKRSRRAEAVLGFDGNGRPGDAVKGLIQDAQHVWFLSGTPAPNDSSELFPMLAAAGIWKGPFSLFRSTFCETTNNGYGEKVTGNKNVPMLREMLSRFALRRYKSDVLKDLPPLVIADVALDGAEIDPHQPVMDRLRQQEQMLHDALDKALQLDNFRLPEVPALATIRRLIGLAKTKPTMELAREILDGKPGQKLVIFAHHREVMAHLEAGLSAYGARMIQGSTTDKNKSASIAAFQTDPTCRVIVGQMQAAGTAITLTAADRLLIVEPSWVPSDNDQAMQRVHRVGQTASCLVQFVSLAGSVDERINEVLRQKSTALREILGPI